MIKLTFKVAVSQRFLPHYRSVFYESLVQRLSASNAEVRLFYGYPMGPVGEPAWAEKIGGFKKRLSLGELEDYAVFSPSLILMLIKYNPDVVIVEDLAGLPNSLMAALYCRVFGKPYLIWGLGNVPGKSSSKLRKYLSFLIKYLYSGAAGFVCYSTYAQSVYSIWGKPTFLAANSCLLPPNTEHVANTVKHIKKRNNASIHSIAAIGELKRQKRFDKLIVALSKLSHSNVCLHLIGDGVERNSLESLAKEHGVSDRIFFHGAVYNQEEKSAILDKCVLGVLPGRGGLVIQELMYRGIPVISGVADGTERDIIVSRRNGYLLSDEGGIIEIAKAIDDFFDLGEEDVIAMSLAALDCVSKRCNVNAMVNGVCEAIHFNR